MDSSKGHPRSDRLRKERIGLVDEQTGLTESGSKRSVVLDHGPRCNWIVHIGQVRLRYKQSIAVGKSVDQLIHPERSRSIGWANPSNLTIATKTNVSRSAGLIAALRRLRPPKG